MKKQMILLSSFIVLWLLLGCQRETELSPTLPKTLEKATETPTKTPETTQEPTEKATKKPTLLAEAQTELLDYSQGRLHNIQLASTAINGYVLKPGATFSFNQIVGKRTPERGYQDATILVHEEKQQGCGGGVCQVSTTVYQAAEKAGLSILERNSHGKEVGYAEQGQDAAVNYGTLDMKFQNNTKNIVKIYVTVGNGKIIADIYSLP